MLIVICIFYYGYNFESLETNYQYVFYYLFAMHNALDQYLNICVVA